MKPCAGPAFHTGFSDAFTHRRSAGTGRHRALAAGAALSSSQRVKTQRDIAFVTTRRLTRQKSGARVRTAQTQLPALPGNVVMLK